MGAASTRWSSDARGDGAAVAIVQSGVVVTILAFLPGHALGPDRFALPKELALATTALAAWIACLRAPLGAPSHVESLVLLLPMLGAAASLQAINRWEAARALGVCLSGALLFRVSWHLARRGHGQRLLDAIVAATTLAALLAMLEAHGIVRHLASGSRAPGGPVGNRNYLAELLVLALPLILQAHVRAEGWRPAVTSLLLALVAAVLVLSRARGAWLAGAGVVGTIVVLRIAFGTTMGRVMRPAALRSALAAAVAGGVVAVSVPNALRWSSPDPYAGSLRHLVDARAGSGRGRVLQYGHTFHMLGAHPALGVGPGNWHIRYPELAPADDPSIDAFALTPTSRFPQGDWLGLAAELGVPALLAALLAGTLVVRHALRALRAECTRHGDAEILGALTLLSLLAAIVVAGATDAVLLQPAPLTISAVAVAALAAPLSVPLAAPLAGREPARQARATSALVAAALAVNVALASRQAMAGYVATSRPAPDGYIAAARLNPADYQLNVWLADYWIRSGSCPRSTPYIRAARRLFPSSPQVARLERQCRLVR